MADGNLLGIFKDPAAVAEAIDNLRQADFTDDDFEVLTGAPYPEGAFGERPKGHRVFVFPLMGALSGFAVAMLLTIGTQISYPLVTGGKPLISIPPMLIVAYEGTMLGAIIFTVLGVILESRLPRFGLGLYDPRITEGYIGLLVSSEGRVRQVEEAFRRAGAEDIKYG